MTYARLATITAWLLVVVFAIGCGLGLLLELEHGLGPGREVWSVEGYSWLFTAHGVTMVYGVIRLGLLAPVLLVAAARKNPEPVPGAWIASVGVLASLICIGLALPGSTARLSAPMTAAALRWVTRSAALGELGIGLGVVIGLARAERTPYDVTMLLLAAAMALVGGIDLLVIDAPSLEVLRAMMILQIAVVVALASEPASRRVQLRARWVVGALVIAVIFAVLTRWMTDALDLLGATLELLGMLWGAFVLLGSSDESPGRPVLRGAAVVLVVMGLVRFYLATLSVDVHLRDTYFAVAEVHLSALFVLALGGSLALRRSFPERYRGDWARVSPWAIVGALLCFIGALAWLGWSGMPRRYYAYLPEYLTGHRVAAVGAALLGAALLGEAMLWIRGRSR